MLLYILFFLFKPGLLLSSPTSLGCNLVVLTFKLGNLLIKRNYLGLTLAVLNLKILKIISLLFDVIIHLFVSSVILLFQLSLFFCTFGYHHFFILQRLIQSIKFRHFALLT